MDFLYVIAGLVILVLGGDALVRGAVGLSNRLGISPLVVSLTVVAFGTSAPELLIGIDAALEGVPELALGNVVGSNVANVLLVLGIPALVFGLQMKSGSETNFYHMIGASLLFVAICFTAPLGKWQGSLLVIVLAMILFMAYRGALASREKLAELESEVDTSITPDWKIGIFLISGLIALPIGAHLLITGAVSIAKALNVSEAVIGLTLVALGTSLPELAASIAAGARRQADVAIGNVLGSNMFNILAIIGVTSLVADVPVPDDFYRMDLWVMLGSSLLLAPFILWQINLSRIWGALFCAAYAGYVAVLLS